MIKNWQDTRIWQLIAGRKSEVANDVRTLLSNPLVMDSIQSVLQDGDSSPKDFTLHDEQHSFRVAERMIEILPAETVAVLSEYDLMMLLLSAYLHDIGMTPVVNKIERHFKCLFTEDKTTLDESEIREFQKWLDNENVIVDITRETLTDIFKVNELLTYYCRYKHNDWSEEWIVNNLSNVILPGYQRWQTDLIRICKSHHYGESELLREYFNPKIINRVICHRRLVALCLRVADVMEIDPERTPTILFKHRDISQRSIPYWLKDQEITITINEGAISFYARPQKAYLHKAVDETIEQIENELKICNTVIVQRPLENLGVLVEPNYHWHLEFFNKDVRPFEDSYVYIKGSFRPNVSRVLELLGGEELYGNTFAAVREILQNALDSVKESIAYKRLQNGWKEPSWQHELGKENKVQLKVVKEGSDYWLVCNDTGVGMTRNIIENYFLVSGASQRHEISELFRRCYDAGIEYERTGQFGIGVLSYFMLGDRIVINTKREQHTGYEDSESAGWEFEINGLQDFGELRYFKRNYSGTEIKVQLKPEIYSSGIEEFEKRLQINIRQFLVKTPCKVEVLSTRKDLLFEATIGWVGNEQFLTQQLLQSIYWDVEVGDEDNSPSHLFDSFKEQEIRPVINEEFKNKYIQTLRWLKISSHVTSCNAHYRVFIPYFLLDTGLSFHFAYEKYESEKCELLSAYPYFSYIATPSFALDSNIQCSYKGIKIGADFVDLKETVDVEYLRKNSFYVEIDFGESSKVSVDRKTLKLGASDSEMLFDSILDSVNRELARLIDANKQSYWTVKNNLFARRVTANAEVECRKWVFKDADQIMLRDISYPLCVWRPQPRPVFRFLPMQDGATIEGVQITFPSGRGGEIFSGVLDVVDLCFFSHQFCLISRENMFSGSNIIHPTYLVANFSSTWGKIVMFRTGTNNPRSGKMISRNTLSGDYTKLLMVNSNFSNAKMLSFESFSKFVELISTKTALTKEVEDEILCSPHLSTEFMLHALSQRGTRQWTYLIKNNYSFLKKLWAFCFGDANDKWVYFYPLNLNIYTLDGVESRKLDNQLQDLPDLDEKFIVRQADVLDVAN